jgi:predicted AAA+ superfamily ATPase
LPLRQREAVRGAIFETWAVSEALKNFHNRGAELDLCFWRDSAGHEIDLLLDQGAKQIFIGIKSGQTIAGDFFKEIEYWRQLAGPPEAAAALLYGGNGSYRRRGIAVVSWMDWA